MFVIEKREKKQARSRCNSKFSHSFISDVIVKKQFLWIMSPLKYKFIRYVVQSNIRLHCFAT